MQYFIDQFLAQECKQHKLHLERICIEVQCKHPNRGMCPKCPKNTRNEVNIYDLFDFLLAQRQGPFDYNTYKQKASLFQIFLRLKQSVMECLDKIQVKLESIINSISESFNDGLRRVSDSSRMYSSLNPTDELWELFSTNISLTENQKLELKKKDDGLQQARLNELIERMKEWGKLSQNDQIMKYINSYQQQISRDYKISYTIQTPNYCKYISFDHNAAQIAALVDEKTIIIFYLSETGEWTQGKTINGVHQKQITQVKFNHNSTLIVSSNILELIIWNKQINGQWNDLININRLWAYRYKKNPCNSSCMNHDSTLLALGTNKIIINGWRNGNLFNITTLKDIHGIVTALCFNKDSTILASGISNRELVLWKLSFFKNWVIKQKLLGHNDGVCALQFNTESTLLASGSLDNSVKIWAANQNGIWECINTLTGHFDTVDSVQFNYQSNMIISRSIDNSIKIWKIEQDSNWKCTQTIKGVCSAIINKDDQIFCASIQNKEIQVYIQ